MKRKHAGYILTGLGIIVITIGIIVFMNMTQIPNKIADGIESKITEPKTDMDLNIEE